MGSIRGMVVGPANGALVRLAAAEGGGPSLETRTGVDGRFYFSIAPSAWNVLSVWNTGYREVVRAVQVESQGSADVGRVTLQIGAVPKDPVRVLTVCEALEDREAISHQRVVIVGIFKSGMDETLRLDCSTQLVTGELGWPSAIGLTGPSSTPDESLRSVIEQKRQEVLRTGPPGALPRPERVVGLYGIFAAPSGLTNAPCCKTGVETVLPPARLFGISETDLRVIR